MRVEREKSKPERGSFIPKVLLCETGADAAHHGPELPVRSTLFSTRKLPVIFFPYVRVLTFLLFSQRQLRDGCKINYLEAVKDVSGLKRNPLI